MATQTGPFSFYRGKTSRSKHVQLEQNQRVRVPGAYGRIQQLRQGTGRDSHILWADVILENGRKTGVVAEAVRPA